MTSVGLPKTVTVARLLADQGHVARAREVLLEVLERAPGDAQAEDLVRSLRGRSEGAPATEPADEALAAPVPGDPAAMAASFRARLDDARPSPPVHDDTLRRLRALLDRVREARGESSR